MESLTGKCPRKRCEEVCDLAVMLGWVLAVVRLDVHWGRRLGALSRRRRVRATWVYIDRCCGLGGWLAWSLD